MFAMPEHIEDFLRICIAYMVMFILFILGMVSFSTPLSTTIEIPFILMILYYWMIYRPSLISPLLIFFVGLSLDFLSGFPIGVSSFILLIVRHIVFDQRVFLTGQNFMVIWLGFIIVSSLSLLTQWGVFGLISFGWTPILPVILTIISGILLFPAIAMTLHFIHKILPLLQDKYSVIK